MRDVLEYIGRFIASSRAKYVYIPRFTVLVGAEVGTNMPFALTGIHIGGEQIGVAVLVVLIDVAIPGCESSDAADVVIDGVTGAELIPRTNVVTQV